ncbi:MAG: HAD family phosphatase [Clostridia bacterium]|nr:HAD family phosphatase [Clostridia bacterium]
MIKNYIFDFGNVLAEFYPEKLTKPFVEDEKLCKEISEIAFDRLYWDKLDDGSITDEEVKEGFLSRTDEKTGELACRVYDNWINSLTPVPNMEKLIYDIRKTDKKLYLLSNISIGFAERYMEAEWIKELFSCFDGLVFSGPVGKVKPDREIFEQLLSEFNLKAEECLFIDDSETNIKGAEKIGIKGYLFDGDAEKLREYLGL